MFLVLQGTAQFTTGRDGKTVVNAGRNHAVVLPAGCYYQFCNSGTEPLVMARIGAGSDKADHRLNPDGSAIPGRTHEQGAAKPVLLPEFVELKGGGKPALVGASTDLPGRASPIGEVRGTV